MRASRARSSSTRVGSGGVPSNGLPPREYGEYARPATRVGASTTSLAGFAAHHARALTAATNDDRAIADSVRRTHPRRRGASEGVDGVTSPPVTMSPAGRARAEWPDGESPHAPGRLRD